MQKMDLQNQIYTCINLITLICRVFAYLLLLLLWLPCNAQGYLADVQFYNYENGLAGRFANCTFKDSRGIVWIGTQFGLNRFDGRDFLTFNETTGLPFPQVMEIYEDAEGWLWLYRSCVGKQSCTYNLAFLHAITHQVLTFEERFGDQVDFPQADITSIVTNENDDVFLSARKQVIQWSGGKIKRKIDLTDFKKTPTLIAAQGEESLMGWYHDDSPQGEAFLNYMVFNLEGEILNTQALPNPLKQKSLRTLRSAGKDHYGRQLIKFDYHFLSPASLLTMQEDGSLQESYSVWSSLEKPQKYYFDTTLTLAWEFDKYGPRAFAPSGEVIYKLADDLPEFEKPLAVRQVRFDEDGLIWVAGRYGVLRIQLQQNRFKRILHNAQSDLDSPVKYICGGVVDMENGNLLLCTQQGLFETDTTHYTPKKLISEYIKPSSTTLTKGYQNDYWTVKSSGLLKVTPSEKDYKISLVELNKAHSFHQLLSQYFDGKRLWFGTMSGLFCVDFASGERFPLKKLNGYEELQNSIVHHIYEESPNKVWLCTSKGLYLFSPDQGVLAHYAENGKDQFKIPGRSFYQIHPAKHGGWWLASQQGLVYWNPDSNTTKIYSTKDGLISNEILAVHEDDYGYLWMPTNHGLIQFHIKTGSSKVWIKADGIASNDFEPYSYFCEENGTVWFGSTNGYTVFHPKDFKDIDFSVRPDVPLVILNYEQFSELNNQLENRTEELLDDPQIILLPGERIFNLQVALLDYINGDAASYAYQIEGYQNYWEESSNNLIRISGLPYGKFNLKIRGRLANGQYSANEINLPIHVIKPFYLRTWVLALMGCLLLLATWIVFKIRTDRLKKRQAELEKIVDERTKELVQERETIAQQAAALRQLDDLKSRFFTNVSHELRTPLSLMVGPVNSLLKRTKEKSEEKKLLQFVQRNAKQLQKLINEILDLAKLENNKIVVNETPIHFYAYLMDQVAQFNSYAASDSLEFEVNLNIDKTNQILLDQSKFEKILHNFLSNAMKFTPPNGTVSLSVEESHSQYLIEVRDTGKGIHPDDLPHIFDRFYQSKQPNAKTEGGTGIGLSLCKEMAELLGGKVWAESELGKGSAFYLQLPKVEVTSLSEAELGRQEGIISTPAPTSSFEITPSPIPIASSPEDVTSKPTILVVEDNADLREYLQFLLAEYEIITAENGKEALLQLEGTQNSKFKTQNSPDLILSDLMMPVMDGFQLLEKLKSDDRWRHIPTIMLTAKVNARAKLNALRIGVDDYLNKPFQEDELKVRIENLLRNYRERMAVFSKTETAVPPDDATSRPVMTQADAEWLAQVEISFAKHLNDSSFSVQQTAELLHVSPRQFRRRISRLTGLPPKLYLQEMRLQKAKDLLLSGHYTTVKETAHATGFRNVRYFSDLFQQHFAILPSSLLR